MGCGSSKIEKVNAVVPGQNAKDQDPLSTVKGISMLDTVKAFGAIDYSVTSGMNNLANLNLENVRPKIMIVSPDTQLSKLTKRWLQEEEHMHYEVTLCHHVLDVLELIANTANSAEATGNHANITAAAPSHLPRQPTSGGDGKSRTKVRSSPTSANTDVGVADSSDSSNPTNAEYRAIILEMGSPELELQADSAFSSTLSQLNVRYPHIPLLVLSKHGDEKTRLDLINDFSIEDIFPCPPPKRLLLRKIEKMTLYGQYRLESLFYKQQSAMHEEQHNTMKQNAKKWYVKAMRLEKELEKTKSRRH